MPYPCFFKIVFDVHALYYILYDSHFVTVTVLATVTHPVPVTHCYTKAQRFPAAFWLLFAGGFLVTAAIVSLLIVLIVCEKTLGLSVGVCAAAAFCAAIVMGFSPTVFASGQRVFFFTNVFWFTACVLLFSSLNESKGKTVALNATVVYACGTFCLNCFAFRLFEHPLMG